MKAYLDHAAATPVDPLVVQAMLPYFSDKFFNPSSPYSAAVEVKREYNQAKASIARSLGVMSDELVMTAGATESVNLAFSAAGSGRNLISAIEHDSVIVSAKRCGDSLLVMPDKKGRISADTVRQKLTFDTSFVSIALANHELGCIQPIEEISAVIKAERERRLANGEKMPLLLHTDASQAAMLIDLKIKRLGVDLLTLSAAKVYGPKQVGLLWIRPGVKLRPSILGGGQENGLRSGTENVAGTIGFATALEIASKRRSSELKRLSALRARMIAALKSEFVDLIISSSDKKSLANFINISFPGVDAERLVFLLEGQGVMVATGSACAANSGTRSHVLKAIGLSDAEVDGSLRITLGRLNDEKSIDEATRLIIDAVKSERKRIK